MCFLHSEERIPKRHWGAASHGHLRETAVTRKTELCRNALGDEWVPGNVAARARGLDHSNPCLGWSLALVQAGRRLRVSQGRFQTQMLFQTFTLKWLVLPLVIPEKPVSDNHLIRFTQIGQETIGRGR